MKLRSLAVGLSLLTAGTVIGAATTQLASASVSSGDKPILVPVEPCRLVDTRPGDATIGPRSSPLGTADTFTVDAQEPGTPCTGVIPSGALSLALNVTALNATQQSFLTIWAGGARPGASSLNPAPGEPPTPNAVTVDLSADQEFEVYNNLGSVNILVDITGYYVDHNHDDRYYTQDQVDDAIAASQRLRSLSSVAFSVLGSGWTRSNGFVARLASGSESCAQAAIEVPTGATVDAVTLRYQTFTSADVDIIVRGVGGDQLLFDTVFDEPVATEQVIGDFSVADSRVVTSGAVATQTDTGYVLNVCSADSIRLISATVEFG